MEITGVYKHGRDLGVKTIWLGFLLLLMIARIMNIYDLKSCLSATNFQRYFNLRGEFWEADV